MSPGAEMDRDRGLASRHAPAWAGPPSWSRPGQGGGAGRSLHGGGRPGEETVGLPLAEAAQILPASCGISAGPSQLPRKWRGSLPAPIGASSSLLPPVEAT